MRKHIDNKHADKLLAAKRAALEPKYRAYYLAQAERAAALPPNPPHPPRFSRDFEERRRDRQGSEHGKGSGKGKGGGVRGGHGGKGYGALVVPREGKPPPPPEGAELPDRPVVTYNDLANPDDDDLFS